MPYKSEKQRKYMHVKLPEIAKKWDKEQKKKKPLLTLIIFLCLFSAGFSGYVAVNSCTSFSGTNGINLTGNIVVSNSTSLTHGACIYAEIGAAGGAGTQDIYLNGYNITNNGSVANAAIYVNITGANAQTFSFYGNSKITAFPNGIILGDDGAAAGARNWFINTSNTNISILNSTSAIVYNGTMQYISKFTITGITPCYSRNFIYSDRFNASTVFTISTNTNADCYLIPSLLDGSNASLVGQQLLSSNKVQTYNIHANNMTFNGNSSGITYWQAWYGNALQTINTSAAWYLNNPIYIGGGYPFTSGIFNPASIIEHYCIGYYCNPLYFNNFSQFPFYIYAPDAYQGAQVSFPYSTLKFYWNQGGTYYLVASANNSLETYFVLQPNGNYQMEVNGTNQTITFNCPSSFSYCFVEAQNGSFQIATPALLQTLLNDIQYSYYWNNGTANLSASNNFLPYDVNMTFAISSNSSTLAFYWMNITKEYNLTTSNICFQNASGNPAGGVLACPTNGTGRYDIRVCFKSSLYTLTYCPTIKTLWIGNNTGLAAIGRILSSGTVIPGWIYALIAVILTALGMGFVSRFLPWGSGLIGIVLLWIFTILWNAPLNGSISMVHMSMIATIAGAAWFMLGKNI